MPLTGTRCCRGPRQLILRPRVRIRCSTGGDARRFPRCACRFEPAGAGDFTRCHEGKSLPTMTSSPREATQKRNETYGKLPTVSGQRPSIPRSARAVRPNAAGPRESFLQRVELRSRRAGLAQQVHREWSDERAREEIGGGIAKTTASASVRTGSEQRPTA